MLTHVGTQTLKTPRLTLRRFTSDDAEAMFENWASDPEVTKFLSWKPHESAEATRQLLNTWIQNYENSDYYHWIIVLNETNTPVGSLAAVGHNDKTAMVHIGYCIGKAFWNRGITSEALAAAIEFFFTMVGINRIEAIHDPENTHSGDVMKKCGMKYEGTLRQAGISNRGIHDICEYSILKSEWEKR